jgi:ketosteroid isomerase-like protein
MRASTWRARVDGCVEDEAEAPASEKLCRELVRRFQAAINGMDVPAMVALLSEEQPVSVRGSPRLRIDGGACANDAWYGLALAASMQGDAFPGLPALADVVHLVATDVAFRALHLDVDDEGGRRQRARPRGSGAEAESGEKE